MDDDLQEDEQEYMYSIRATLFSNLLFNLIGVDHFVEDFVEDFVEVEVNDHLDRLENDIMNAAMEESLNFYNTQEKKPNIKLNVKSNRATLRLAKDMCVICNSNFIVNETVTKLKCKHILHTDCIAEWIKYKAECPICRAKVDTKVDTTTTD